MKEWELTKKNVLGEDYLWKRDGKSEKVYWNNGKIRVIYNYLYWTPNENNKTELKLITAQYPAYRERLYKNTEVSVGF